MIIPVRCFTCGKVLADKWEYYDKKVKELEKKLENMIDKTKVYKTNMEGIFQCVKGTHRETNVSSFYRSMSRSPLYRTLSR